MIEFQYERPAAVNFREPPFLLLLLLPVRFSLTSSHLLGVVMVFSPTVALWKEVR